jgi:hypothetical protein
MDDLFEDLLPEQGGQDFELLIGGWGQGIEGQCQEGIRSKGRQPGIIFYHQAVRQPSRGELKAGVEINILVPDADDPGVLFMPEAIPADQRLIKIDDGVGLIGLDGLLDEAQAPGVFPQGAKRSPDRLSKQDGFVPGIGAEIGTLKRNNGRRYLLFEELGKVPAPAAAYQDRVDFESAAGKHFINGYRLGQVSSSLSLYGKNERTAFHTALLIWFF